MPANSFFSVALSIALSFSVFAGFTAQAEESSNVVVMVDRAKVFRIDEPASTVIVGNPFIADVAMQDLHTVVVTGKAYGSTNLVILNDKNEPVIDELVIVQAPTENTVSVTRKTARTTYSCTPACEPTLRMGDSPDSFAQVAEQSNQRNTLAVQAAGPTN